VESSASPASAVVAGGPVIAEPPSGDAENPAATASAALQPPLDLHLDNVKHLGIGLENGLEVPASPWNRQIIAGISESSPRAAHAESRRLEESTPRPATSKRRRKKKTINITFSRIILDRGKARSRPVNE